MQENQKSLRAVSPKLYRLIMAGLEDEYHIQPYDVQAEAVKKDTGFQVILRFGEQFTENQEQFFSFEAVSEKSDQVKEFVQTAGDACKQVLIEDYYRIMAP